MLDLTSRVLLSILQKDQRRNPQMQQQQQQQQHQQRQFVFDQGALVISPALQHPHSITSVNDITHKLLSTAASEGAVDSLAVTRLVVGASNRLSSFAGVAAFPSLESLSVAQNVFRSLDSRSGAATLAALPALRELDLTENNISRVDLCSSQQPQQTPAWCSLSCLVLSGNVLAEIPDLRCLVSLRELYLDRNEIQSLRGIENKFYFPLAAPDMRSRHQQQLEVLSLANNSISDWREIIELAALSDSLKDLSLAENPVVDMMSAKHQQQQQHQQYQSAANSDNDNGDVIAFDLRMALVLLLPHLQTIDGELVTQKEKAVADEAFHSAAAAIALQPPVDPAKLGRYLMQVFPLRHRRRNSNSGSASNNNRATSSSPQQGGDKKKGGDEKNGDEDDNNNNKIASRDFVESELAKVHGRISKCVEVIKPLRHQNLIVRHSAASTIQKLFRGYVVRRRLTQKYSNFGLWRAKIMKAQAAARGKRIVDAVMPFGAGASSISVSSSSSSSSSSSKQQQQQIDQLQTMLKTLWSDVQHLSGFLRTQRVAAAKVIQKFWRGYVARKRFARVKQEFKNFAKKFLPSILKIQATYRMHFQRKRYLVQRQKERRITTLESEVGSLKQQVTDLCKAFSLIKVSGAAAMMMMGSGAGSPSAAEGSTHTSSYLARARSQQQQQQQQQRQDQDREESAMRRATLSALGSDDVDRFVSSAGATSTSSSSPQAAPSTSASRQRSGYVGIVTPPQGSGAKKAVLAAMNSNNNVTNNGNSSNNNKNAAASASPNSASPDLDTIMKQKQQQRQQNQQLQPHVQRHEGASPDGEQNLFLSGADDASPGSPIGMQFVMQRM